MRTRTWTAIAVSVLLMLGSSTLGGALPAHASGPVFHVTPDSGPQGSKVIFFGSGYAPNESVSIHLNCDSRGCVIQSGQPVVGTTTTDVSGNFSVELSLPAHSGFNGTYPVAAEGGSGPNDDIAFLAFTFVQETLVSAPASSAAGAHVTFSGVADNHDGTITVKFNCYAADCTSQHTLGTATPDPNTYQYSLTGTIPMFAPGTYWIDASTHNIDGTTRSTAIQFTIVPSTLTPSPASDPTGSTASVSGTGFQANEAVTIKWNCSRIDCSSHYTLLPNGERSFQGVHVLGTATADSSGNFTHNFTVPPFTPASYPIAAIGNTSNTFAKTSFTVSPAATVTVSPSSGHPGSGYSATGTGFQSGETVTVKFNCASQSCSSLHTLGSATAQPNRTFSIASVTIPNFSAKSYPVAAIGGTSNTLATTTFTIN
jgi:hypothetical protein